MEIVAISDIHGFLEKPENMPLGDVLCICGDIVPLEYQTDTAQSIAWFCLEFVPWTDALPYKHILFCGGNHDFFLEFLHNKGEQIGWRSPAGVLRKLLPGNNKAKHKLIYLCDNSVEIEGKRFYGTPWISDLSQWAFYKNSEKLKAAYENIPKNCDVIMTHMPPKIETLGTVKQLAYNQFKDYGSQELAEVLETRNFKYAICGHVHSGQHNVIDKNNRKFVNVSIKDEGYRVFYKPFKFEI